MLDKIKYVAKGISYTFLAILGLGTVGLSEVFLKLTGAINDAMEKINPNK